MGHIIVHEVVKYISYHPHLIKTTIDVIVFRRGSVGKEEHVYTHKGSNCRFASTQLWLPSVNKLDLTYMIENNVLCTA